jgi:phosphopantothenoylcysteine decarboxylase/phosphopantothenate--cysteine ligase
MESLHNKKILLIISGGIAAYKILDLIRNLKKKNCEIKTILTESAKEFVTSLSIASLSQNKVYDNKFDISNELEMDHIALSRWCDIILIAPATANLLSRLASGSADDFISTVVSAANKDIFLVPAMNVEMWNNPATQDNIKKLLNFNYKFIGPISGELACGEIGEGKMSSINEIEKTLEYYFVKKNKKFSKQKALVTAGPTREYLDPVRYLSNESSGKQGFEIAKKLHEVGFETTLITGPTNINYPKELNVIRVISAQQMLDACQNLLPVDIAVCAAAVVDFNPEYKNDKIKKDELSDYNLKLNKNIDILEYLSNHNKNRPKLVIGFAAETENVLENALKKLNKKNCDWIIANDVSDKSIGFNSDNNEVMIIYKNQRIEKISKVSKTEVASEITNRIISATENKYVRNIS